MIGPWWQVLAAPAIAGAGVLPARLAIRHRRGWLPDPRAVELGASAVALALSVARLGWGGEGRDGFWLDDPLGRTMLVLAILPWTASASLSWSRGGSGSAGAGRVAVRGVAAGGAALACLADSLFPVLLGLALVLLTPRSTRRWDARYLLVPAAIVAASWSGVVMAAAAAGRPASWSGSLGMGPHGNAAIAAMLQGTGLVAAFWYGIAGPAPDRETAAIRRGGIGSVATCLLLRATASPVAAPVRTALLLAGCAMLAWAAAATWARLGHRDRRDVADGTAAVLGGAVALGLATGSGAGVTGALLGLFSLGTAYPLALLGAPGWRRRTAAAALGGMPPFAPFAALLLVAERGFASSTAATLLLLGAVAVSGSALSRPRGGQRSGAFPVGRGTAGTELVLLFLLLLGGALLPFPVADWLSRFTPPAAGGAR